MTLGGPGQAQDHHTFHFPVSKFSSDEKPITVPATSPSARLTAAPGATSPWPRGELAAKTLSQPRSRAQLRYPQPCPQHPASVQEPVCKSFRHAAQAEGRLLVMQNNATKERNSMELFLGSFGFAICHGTPIVVLG